MKAYYSKWRPFKVALIFIHKDAGQLIVRESNPCQVVDRILLAHILACLVQTFSFWFSPLQSNEFAWMASGMIFLYFGRPGNRPHLVLRYLRREMRTDLLPRLSGAGG
eukprot:scaffold22145_cov167-Amphora_coffeaeformis.AAC.8